MDSDSSQYKAANSHLKNLNKNISGLNRARKQQKIDQKANDQKFILERLRFVSDSMHKAGASQQSTRLALQGTYEFLKVTLHQKLEKSADEFIKNPDSIYDAQRNQAPVTFLSEVETQQVDWLWHKRIPLGKITILRIPKKLNLENAHSLYHKTLLFWSKRSSKQELSWS